MTNISFSQPWSLEIQNQGASMVGFLVKTLLLAYKLSMSHRILTLQREKKGDLSSCSHKDTSLIVGVPPSRPNSSLSSAFPYHHIRASTYTSGGGYRNFRGIKKNKTKKHSIHSILAECCGSNVCLSL